MRFGMCKWGRRDLLERQWKSTGTEKGKNGWKCEYDHLKHRIMHETVVRRNCETGEENGFELN
jgi:hypothetical protein